MYFNPQVALTANSYEDNGPKIMCFHMFYIGATIFYRPLQRFITFPSNGAGTDSFRDARVFENLKGENKEEKVIFEDSITPEKEPSVCRHVLKISSLDPEKIPLLLVVQNIAIPEARKQTWVCCAKIKRGWSKKNSFSLGKSAHCKVPVCAERLLQA